ncbi:MAG TPA: hemin uptake protein HemP [Burkholderiales bacterium]|jgi:Hemin uptake protein
MNNKVEQSAVQACAATRPATAGSIQPTRVSSQTLLGSTGELVIEHAGREYRLRVTQNGKLILTA